jgi:hypothetical protein
MLRLISKTPTGDSFFECQETGALLTTDRFGRTADVDFRDGIANAKRLPDAVLIWAYWQYNAERAPAVAESMLGRFRDGGMTEHDLNAWSTIEGLRSEGA